MYVCMYICLLRWIKNCSTNVNPISTKHKAKIYAREKWFVETTHFLVKPSLSQSQKKSIISCVYL